MGLSAQHILLLLIIALLLFGRGKISELMGDVAQGIKAFKKGMADDDTTANAPAKPAGAIESRATQPVETTDQRKVG